MSAPGVKEVKTPLMVSGFTNFVWHSRASFGIPHTALLNPVIWLKPSTVMRNAPWFLASRSECGGHRFVQGNRPTYVYQRICVSTARILTPMKGI